jgi:hypothetical protein
MKTRPIKFAKQVIHSGIMKEALTACYENIAFSTFPYIKYKLFSSEKTLDKYNSGNCIALSTFIKRYLKANYNVKSYIIPATVPSIFRVEGTPALCHVSLLVPITTTTYYIVDPAFYFLEPIHAKGFEQSLIDTMNIHNQIHEPIHFKRENDSVLCWFKPEDPWSYYTYEVLDPDESIGCHFIRQKPEPFLCKTMVLPNGDVYKKYHLKEANNILTVIKDHQEIYSGLNTEIPESLKRELQIYLFKYFKTR